MVTEPDHSLFENILAIIALAAFSRVFAPSGLLPETILVCYEALLVFFLHCSLSALMIDLSWLICTHLFCAVWYCLRETVLHMLYGLGLTSVWFVLAGALWVIRKYGRLGDGCFWSTIRIYVSIAEECWQIYREIKSPVNEVTVRLPARNNSDDVYLSFTPDKPVIEWSGRATDLEYQPNPVILAHRQEDTSNSASNSNRLQDMSPNCPASNPFSLLETENGREDPTLEHTTATEPSVDLGQVTVSDVVGQQLSHHPR